MHYERILPAGSGDPLRYTDARFEPTDPLFDAEEPAPVRPWRRKRSAVAAALAATVACGGVDRPGIHATDSYLVQLVAAAAPHPQAGGADVSSTHVAMPNTTS